MLTTPLTRHVGVSLRPLRRFLWSGVALRLSAGLSRGALASGTSLGTSAALDSCFQHARARRRFERERHFVRSSDLETVGCVQSLRFA